MAFDHRAGSVVLGVAGLAVALAIAWTGLGGRAGSLASAAEGGAAAPPGATSKRFGRSGLPLPRFMSLKAEVVNVRYGPSSAHGIAFVFNREGMPVEIVAEFETWRRVRDSDGDEGWVPQDKLARERTAAVAPWRQGETVMLLASPNASAAPVARLGSGIITKIEACAGDWCRVRVEGYSGWLERTLLWGVYGGEAIE